MPLGHSCGLYMMLELKFIIPQRHSRGSVTGKVSLTYCGEDEQIWASRGHTVNGQAVMAIMTNWAAARVHFCSTRPIRSSRARIWSWPSRHQNSSMLLGTCAPGLSAAPPKNENHPSEVTAAPHSISLELRRQLEAVLGSGHDIHVSPSIAIFHNGNG